jgi:hypothetical protein
MLAVAHGATTVIRRCRCAPEPMVTAAEWD